VPIGAIAPASKASLAFMAARIGRVHRTFDAADFSDDAEVDAHHARLVFALDFFCCTRAAE
jgi:hypothetical protein